MPRVRTASRPAPQSVRAPRYSEAEKQAALQPRSAQAAREIKALISASNEQVGQGVILVAETRAALDRIVEQVQVIDFLMQHISRATAEQAFSLGVSTRRSTIWIRRGSKTRWASQCQRADTVTLVSRHHESLRLAERLRSGRAKNSKMMLTCKWLIQRSMCEPHASLRVIRPPQPKPKTPPFRQFA